jgi:hypothetical protein
MVTELDVVAFRPWHLKLFTPGDQYDTIQLTPEEQAKVFRYCSGYTLLFEGDIIAIIGVVPVWPGVAEVTMIPSQLFYKHVKSVLKLCKQLLPMWMDALNVHRVQALTLDRCPKHGRFMLAMGFAYEGTLAQYTPNRETLCMYSMVRK